MNGPEHYAEAELLLTGVAGNSPPCTDLEAQIDGNTVAAAQVHATLALAAAVAYPAVKDYTGDEDGSVSRGWAGVA